MKQCTKCKKWKKKKEFSNLTESKDGLNYRCKKCVSEYRKKWMSNPETRKRVNKNAAKFRRTEAGKMIKRRYYYSEKGQKAYYKYPRQKTDKVLARQAVNHAVESGKIPRVKTLKCNMSDGTCEGRMEYHHQNGYDKENWLDVIPLCRKHHCIIDGHTYHTFDN